MKIYMAGATPIRYIEEMILEVAKRRMFSFQYLDDEKWKKTEKEHFKLWVKSRQERRWRDVE
jgi:hypothetical protein